MDRFEAMRLYIRIVERHSFSQAARDLGVPKASATYAIKHLEDRLGTRLLERTTRQVRPTAEGAKQRSGRSRRMARCAPIFRARSRSTS